jgi:hypothetical protein
MVSVPIGHDAGGIFDKAPRLPIANPKCGAPIHLSLDLPQVSIQVHPHHSVSNIAISSHILPNYRCE